MPPVYTYEPLAKVPVWSIEISSQKGRMLEYTLEKDINIVTSTVRQRLLLRSSILACTTEEFGHMQSIGATVQAIASRLQTLWPPDEYAMPYYPAFRMN